MCAAKGWTWRRLRWCATCGNVGCCDSSRGAHAHAHHLATGHPVAVSLAADEEWAWCFEDELFLVPAGPRAAPSTRHPTGEGRAGRPSES
ncbi:UBP-type zinc finger domain-containing protein [Streptomyces sp. NPDC058877]|uniref:UBP-type zinc finger domain-containing protein n=1 Tax=unclassified Streptomyces TaxID=2593676 RepID=UPI0036CD8ABD